jgi:nucleotide-binding universal stress UspA family protein
MGTSPKVDRILFATDFLASSHVALDYAIAFAQHFQATIVMVHALELSYPAREAETEASRPSVTRRLAFERLESLSHRVRCSGLQAEISVEDGIPSEVVLRSVSVHRADLLVLGVNGVHRGLAHLLVGSNTESMLLSTTCPTMTIGAHVMAGVDPGLHFNEILYFSDFSAEATAAAPYAEFLSQEFDAPIDVCQLLPEVAQADRQLRQVMAQEYCESLRLRHPGADSSWCAPSFHLDRGREKDELLERAKSQRAGLIVLGIHTESQLGRRLHTSFAYQLLANATCPVISIRAGMQDGLDFSARASQSPRWSA